MRRRITVKTKLMMLVLGAVLARAAVSATVGAAQTQELRWGGDSEGGAPYVFQDPKNPRETIGFEVELADALGREVKRRAVFVQNQWDGLIPGAATRQL